MTESQDAGEAEPDVVPTRFHLVRDVDESGVSGTGRVAWGTLWPDGSVDLLWRNDENDQLRTTRNGRAEYHSRDGLRDMIAVHGHGGRTRIEWVDEPPRGRPNPYVPEKYVEQWGDE